MERGGRLGPVKIVFLECSVELVPRSLWSHPQVLKSARRYGIEPGDLLLDKSLHYNAMAELPAKWKRGRPDILHVALLTTTDSPLYNEGLLRIYFQVYDGRLFEVGTGVRVPKNYERFRGLVAQLLKTERVPPGEGEALIRLHSRSLAEFVEREGRFILMWEKGSPTTTTYVAARALSTGLPIGVGCFPRGEFKRSTLRKASEAYSIMGGAPLKTWGVASRIVYALERLKSPFT
ncbi:16S rRNA methyltransferase [Aeropyrum pernix]|uniref:16S rRNA methyltransferase n=1 Tax=Aeropyrum pernix TaxID=56636 RepID=UPI000AA3DE7A|nr:16S rRNA methyltransferase [Aeropyrum pernix]